MKKLHEKNELTFSLAWIAVYCVLRSLANPLSKTIGMEYAASTRSASYRPLFFCILSEGTTCRSGILPAYAVIFEDQKYR